MITTAGFSIVDLFHMTRAGLLAAGLASTLTLFAPAATAKRLAAGVSNACAVDAQGRLKCWGGDYPGDGSDSSYAAVTVAGLEQGALEVAYGLRHGCAISTGGRLRCWGNNSAGQLGNGSSSLVFPTAVDVVGLASGTRAVAAGLTHSCAITASAGVRCWGENGSGQLGDNSTTDRRSPVDVLGLANISAIAAGDNHTCALTSAGAVKCWGNNSTGQIGDGATVNRLTPMDVAGLGSGVHAIAAGGNSSCALRTGGVVHCWGRNTSGQLGDGSTTQRNTPVAVINLSGMAEISVGDNHACARSGAGGMQCWGENGRGQLGDGTTVDRVSPVPANGLTSGVIEIAAGEVFTCARRSDQEIRCTGYQGNGRLGNGLGSGQNISTAARLAALPERISAISSGNWSLDTNHAYGHACARSVGGGAWCWGSNYQDQLGDGAGTHQERLGPWPVIGFTSGVSDVASGFAHACLLTTAGAVKCWGDNGYGQIGNNTTADNKVPQDVIGAAAQISQISTGGQHSCARTSSGGVRCWGRNQFGQIGDSTAINRLVATDVAGLLSGVAQVSAGGMHSCAVTAAGAVRCWGNNTSGQLGDGTLTAATTPVAVSGLAGGVAAVSAGDDNSCALLTSGAVKCWGGNGQGQLGDGSISNRLTPVDVIGLGSGSTAQIDAGGAHTCARSSSGGMSCWGLNSEGQLGDGSQSNRAQPTPVTGLGSGVSTISAGGLQSCAVRDGLSLCFGRGTAGQTGDGHTGTYLQPTAVATWFVAGDLIFRNGFQP